jgi:PAS domain S-box-containing protein
MLLGLKSGMDLDHILDGSLATNAIPVHFANTFKKLLSDVVEGRAIPHEAAQKLLETTGQQQLGWLFGTLATLLAAWPKRRHEEQKRLIAFLTEIAEKNEENTRLEQQKIKEEVLHCQASLKKLTPFFENALEGCLLADGQGKIIAVNDTLADMLGEAKERLQGRSWLELLHPEERTKWGGNEQRVGDTALINQKTARLAIHPTADGIAVSILDLSAEKNQAKQLQEESAFWQQLFNALTEGVYVASLDGDIHEMNDAFCKLTGYSKEELRQKGWLELTAPEYREKERSYLADIRSGKTVRFGKEYVHKDGQRIPVLVSCRLLQKKANADKERLIVTCVDMREEKTKEIAWVRIRAAIDVSDAKIMIADPAGIIVYANAAAQKLFRDYAGEVRKRLPHFDPDKIIGSSYDAYHRDPKRTQEIIQQMTSAHRTTIQFGDRTFTFVANPIFLDSKRVGTSVEWRDVTEELQVQQEVETLVAHIKEGDFAMRLSPKEGLLAQRLSGAINALLDESLSLIQYSQNCLERLANAEIVPDKAEKSGAARKIQEAYNATVAALQDLITAIRETTVSIESSSQELSQSQEDLSNRASREAATLEQISANIEEISTAVSENSNHAENTEKLARDVVERTMTGKASVDEVTKIIVHAASGAKETSLISRAIQQIAFQTNILSLNASVEAARAGEHGRGFAVIAEEIRKLAIHTSTEARRTEEIIALLQEGMEKGEQGMLAVNEQVESIQSSANDMAEHIKAIAEATKEQDKGLMELAKAIGLLEEALSQNAAMSEEIHATSESLKAQIGALIAELSHFHLDSASTPLAKQQRPFKCQDFQLDKEVQEAIRQHLAWRRHFAKALENGRVDPQQTKDDARCDFGQWLRRSDYIKSHPQYEEIVQLHRAFHEEAERIATLIKNGQGEKAKEALRSDNGRYNQLTEKLVSALKSLLQEAHAQPNRDKKLPLQAKSPSVASDEWEEF